MVPGAETQGEVRRCEERSDSKSIISPSYITMLERSDSKEKRNDNTNNVQYRLSSRKSLSSSLRSSNISPSYVTNNPHPFAHGRFEKIHKNREAKLKEKKSGSLLNSTPYVDKGTVERSLFTTGR